MRSVTWRTLATVWRQTAARHWRQEWWQSFTLVCILGLGVAAFLSIRLANRAALAGFGGLDAAVSGQSDWTVQAPAGALPEDALPELRAAIEGLPVELVPLLEGSAIDPQSRQELRLLGTDLMAVQNLGSADDAGLVGETTGNWWDLLRHPRAVVIAPGLAQAHGLAVGDTFPVLLQGRAVELKVFGLLPPNRFGVEVPDNLLVLDLPRLQTLLERPDSVARVEVIVTATERREHWVETVRTRLEQPAAGRWEVQGPRSQEVTGAQMTAALRMNLNILSLISLLVGLFLIAQAIDAAVVRRRREIGILRSLGLTPRHIRHLWRLDLAMLGLAGSLLGIFLGWGLAQVAVRAVSRTVNALYLQTTAHSAALTLPDAALALALGLGATWLAGQFPLRDAASTPPAQVMRGGRFGNGFALWQRPVWGFLMVAAGVGTAALPPYVLADQTRLPVGGFAAAFLWLIGGTILAGGVLRPLAALLLRLPVDRLPWKVALVQLREATSRHRLALAGLFVAVGMAASISILVGSFSRTMEEWIEVRFQADLYVSLPGDGGVTREARIPESIWRPIAARPEVAATNAFDLRPVDLDGSRTYLGGAHTELLGGYEKVLWLREPLPASQQPTGTTEGYANESFIRRFEVGAGDVIEMPTPSGPQQIWLRGVVSEYGNDRGSVVVPRATFEQWFGTAQVFNLSLHLHDPATAAEFAEELRLAYPGLEIRSNAALRQTVLRVFRQTFAATEALQILGVSLALVGLALGLVSILRENQGTLRTLHVLGASRRQLALITALEGAGLTLGGLVSGLLLSFALGWLLMYVINRQSFGWTLLYAWPWVALLRFSLLVLVAGGVIGYLVGRQSTRLALEDESR
ncbi:MAG: FtsX-like permease family protein [Verrucomicrobiota bacterium JB022]|nr:FtsX-like permease family protein [Verrucomicrobiota bacterium JB022]